MRIWTAMEEKQRSRWRLAWMALGWLLIVGSPFVGVIPGPGGIIVFAAGAALLIRNSCWAKRHYVRLKRRWPKLGRAADKVMRRSKRPAEAID
jgi:hypothetical protein